MESVKRLMAAGIAVLALSAAARVTAAAAP
jgi:hypothetical protein